MVDVAVVGGGPAGLSAALFTAKNGLDTEVFDTNDTWLHKAHLYNYLGIRNMDGSVFMSRAREQVTKDHAAELHEDEPVEGIEQDGDDFRVVTDDGEYDAEYVVLATGANRDLAEAIGCDMDDDGTVDVNLDMETSIDGVYATGAMARPEKWQAIISAGDGGAAALDILSTEEGEHYHDFDTPEDIVEL